jgi:prophage regulatory protein
MNERIILETERKQRTGVSRTTAWRLEKVGKFPKRRIVSDGLVGWLESEINEWISSRKLAT